MKSFRLLNVKSFQDTGEIELKPITVFVGKNSSGKSSLVRFPVVLGQTFLEETISPIVFNGRYVDYGNFNDVIHNHTGDTLQFDLTFDLRKIGIYSEIYARARWPQWIISKYKDIGLEITIRKVKDKLTVNNYQVSIGSQIIFSVTRKKKKCQFVLKCRLGQNDLISFKKPFSFSLPYIHFKKFIFLDFSPFSDRNRTHIAKLLETGLATTSDSEDKYWKAEEILEQISFLRQLSRTTLYGSIPGYLNSMIDTLSFFEGVNKRLYSYMENFGEQLNYIGPFRTSPQRVYRYSESLYNYVGKEGEHAVMLLRQAQRDQNPLFQNVVEWFLNSLNCKLGIEDIAESNLYRIKVYSDQNPNGDNLIDVGFGISQILPIVVQLYYDKKRESRTRKDFLSNLFPQTVIFEQPEIHLHPNAQAELANLFVARVLDKERKAQILLETHSEHLIRRLQSLVANPDNNFGVNDLAIYYVDLTEQGRSSVSRMEMTEQGQFTKEWPTGFFDKGYTLSRELAVQASKRMAK